MWGWFLHDDDHHRNNNNIIIDVKDSSVHIEDA